MWNKLNHELKQSKTAYHEKMFNESTYQLPDVVWQLINNVLVRGKRDVALEKITLDNGELSGRELADHLSDHFINVGICQEAFRCEQTLSGLQQEITFLALMDEQESYTTFMNLKKQTFMNLKNSKALDIDNIQIKPI